jgi:methylthioribose-1-phosphate isomerase
VRGAPALGAAAGLGMYLGIKDSKAGDFIEFNKELNKVIVYLASSRPTARNLFWGLERMRKVALENQGKSISLIKKLLLCEAKKIIEEDRQACRKIGYYGAKLINKKDTILTICNAGILATVDYGTALGIIYRAKDEGKNIKVYACETRPLLQGARLTAWELNKNAIDVTLICDNMAAVLMKQGKIDKVITGADRIALNGDVANKIGTYNLAVLSYHHKIPFYIAAPLSTFDSSIKNGKDIPIEERSPKEVTELFFKQAIAVNNIKVFNPAFDVTPNNLITAIITDKGIIRPPYKKNIIKIETNKRCW